MMTILSESTIELIGLARRLRVELQRLGLSAEEYYDRFIAPMMARSDDWRVRPRDEDGWIVPRPGTRARSFYDLAKCGYMHSEIAKITKALPSTVRVELQRIQNPSRS